MKILGLIVGLFATLRLIRKAINPWIRIGVRGNHYEVSVPRGYSNGLKYCLLALYYYPKLRSVISAHYVGKEDIIGALEQAVKVSVAQLKHVGPCAGLNGEEELGPIVAPFRSSDVGQRHSYYVEYFSGILGSGGVFNIIADDAPASSLILHYVELLREVCRAVSKTNREILLTSLEELVEIQRSIPATSRVLGVGAGFTHARRLFLTRWLAAPDRDREFNAIHVHTEPLSRIRRVGFSLGVLLQFGSVLPYAVAIHHFGWQFIPVIEFAVPVSAVLWVTAGMLNAQGVALCWATPLATRSMVGNALWKHGAHCRAASIVFFGAWLCAVRFFTQSTYEGAGAIIALASTFLLGTASAIAGYMLFARAIARAWTDRQSELALLEPRASKEVRRPRIGWLPLCMTFPNLLVLVVCGIVLVIVILATRVFVEINAGMLLILIVVTAITATRFGVPELINRYLRSRDPIFTATLLRKFFEDTQARMLRNLVAPCIGAYGRIRTLTDPSFAKGRARALSFEQEWAEAIKDTLTNVEEMIQSPDRDWKDVVRQALSQSGIVVIDVTQMTPSLTWELAASLAGHPPDCILLVCSLDGKNRDKLDLVRSIGSRVLAEIQQDNHASSDLAERFNMIPPPLLYASFPGSLAFRFYLVHRLRRCLAAVQPRGEP